MYRCRCCTVLTIVLHCMILPLFELSMCTSIMQTSLAACCCQTDLHAFSVPSVASIFTIGGHCPHSSTCITGQLQAWQQHFMCLASTLSAARYAQQQDPLESTTIYANVTLTYMHPCGNRLAVSACAAMTLVRFSKFAMASLMDVDPAITVYRHGSGVRPL
jgi:hypothetical protein